MLTLLVSIFNVFQTLRHAASPMQSLCILMINDASARLGELPSIECSRLPVTENVSSFKRNELVH